MLASSIMLIGKLMLVVRTFKTLTIRLARITVNGFLENVDLVVRTLAEFGEDAEQHSNAS
jgi:EKC/KEOPS complex subunit PCC1/LAGE3